MPNNNKKPSRQIIPLADFLTLTPTLLVHRSLDSPERDSKETKAVIDRMLELKLGKDGIELMEKPLRFAILSALKDLGFDGVEVPYTSEYAYTIAIVDKENKTIDREMLLAKGVDPDVIAACTKTTPSQYLEARAKKLK